MLSPLRRMCICCFCGLIVAFLATPLVSQADEPKDQRDKALAERAETFFKPLVDQQWAQGIVVGIVDEQGSRVYGFGRTSPEKAEPPDGETLFEIGSITKVFTGILLADMVERGGLELDDPVNKLLPDDIGQLKCGEREMRLIDLATHTSGLPRMPTNFAPANAADPYADYTADRLYDFLRQRAKPSLTGAFEKLIAGKSLKWEYSNLGAGLLGHLLERKAERSYEELVIERICKPLEMNSTRLTLDAALKARLISGHVGEGDPINPWGFGCLGPCGGLRSSANDMLKFVAANLELKDSPLAASLRKSHESRYTVNERIDMGLNWLLIKPDWIFHNGMTGGYNSVVLFSKSKKVGMLALADTAIMGQAELLDKTCLTFLQAVIDDQPGMPPAIRTTAKVDPAVLEKYIGSYSLVPVLVTVTVTQAEDRLYAQLTGQQKCRLYPESESKFFYKAVDAQITFESDETGNVERLVLHQGGKDLPAGRVGEKKN